MDRSDRWAENDRVSTLLVLLASVQGGIRWVRRLSTHGRILKLPSTISDLGGNEQIQAKHLAEAVQCRSLAREYWK